MSQRNSISIIYRRASLKPWMYVTSQAQGQPRLLFFQHVSASISTWTKLWPGCYSCSLRATVLLSLDPNLNLYKTDHNQQNKVCLIRTGAECWVYGGPPKAGLNAPDERRFINVFTPCMMSFSCWTLPFPSIYPLSIQSIYRSSVCYSCFPELHWSQHSKPGEAVKDNEIVDLRRRVLEFGREERIVHH